MNLKFRLIFKVIFIVLFIFIFSGQILAAEPPGEDVGAQVERLEKSLELKKKEIKEKVKAPEIEIKEKEEEKRPAVEAISFTLKDVKITGSTVFKPEDFHPIYEPYLNKKVTLSDLETIIEKIKEKYRKKGYLTTTVYLPEQEVTEGIIEIRIVEGKMGKLSIEGNKWFSSSLIEKYFHIKKNEILNIRKLQKDVLRLNQNPDLEIKVVISPGQEPHTSDITLKIKEYFPHHFGGGFDNQGTRLVKKHRPSLSFRSTNLTNHFDYLFINTLFGSRSFGESISYSIPINTYGTKFGFDSTYYTMKLGKEFYSFDITGNTYIYTPRISWELALSENFQANADIGMEIKSIKKKITGTITSNDQLRLPYFGFDFTLNDSFKGQTTFSPRFTFSTENFLGASSRNHPTASRAGTGGFFFKYEQSLRRIQRMPLDSYISIRSQFQAASHTLPSSEQFQLGGANSIRGYPEGDYLADIGGNVNADWIFPMFFIPKDWKLSSSGTALYRQLNPVLFLDVGGGKLKKIIPGEKRDKFLMGIGCGIRFQVNRNFYLRLDWAEHIGDRPTGAAGPSTFHFAFQAEL